MYILAGTEGGQIKAVPLSAPRSAPAVPGAPSALRPMEPGARAAAEAAAKAAAAQCTTYGTLDKNAAVVAMASVTIRGREAVLVARANGVVDVWDHARVNCEEDGGTGPLIASVAAFVPPEAMSIVEKREWVKIVEVDALDDTTIMAVNSRGTLAAITLDPAPNTPRSTTTTAIAQVAGRLQTLDLGKDIHRVRPCAPHHRHLLAVGGNERDLHLVDLNAPKSQEADRKEEHLYTGLLKPSAWTGELRHTVVWRARNVPFDSVGLRVPVWITDVRFLNATGTQMATCTAYHEVKFYDTTKQRRPTAVIHVGTQPLRSLTVLPPTSHSDLLVSDSKGAVYRISPTQAAAHARKAARAAGDPDHPRNKSIARRSGKPIAAGSAVAGAYKGAQGAVRQVLAATMPDGADVVCAVGLDRFVRVWDAKSHAVRARWFVKQRLEAAVVWRTPIEGEDAQAQTEGQAEEDEDVGDEVWEELDALERRQLGDEDENEEEDTFEDLAVSAEPTKKRKDRRTEGDADEDDVDVPRAPVKKKAVPKKLKKPARK
ncbi:WD repeat-containing protein 74 [Allomyces arbusculus]|nr:WD repeat-containing protein 74 [Allomyces arbusculus]